MMTLLKGVNILVTGGSAIANYPSWVLWLNHRTVVRYSATDVVVYRSGARAVDIAGENAAR